MALLQIALERLLASILMADGDLDGDALRENRRRFRDFLEQDFGQGTYAARVRTMVESGKFRLIVNLNHLRTFDADFARRWGS